MEKKTVKRRIKTLKLKKGAKNGLLFIIALSIFIFVISTDRHSLFNTTLVLSTGVIDIISMIILEKWGLD